MINVNCVNIPENTFDKSFGNQGKEVYYAIEKYKKENNIARIQGRSFPVVIGIDNQTPYDISDITIEIIWDTKVFTESGEKSDQISICFSNPYTIKSKEYWNGLLFDASGFHQAIIALTRVEYKINDQVEKTRFETNTPLLVNTDDLTNQYHGYQDQQEIQNYLILENYINTSFLARGYSLKFMFKTLNEITQKKSFEFEGETIAFNKEDLLVLQSVLQIDIIAKIMMYVEDLIILLEAILKTDGDYYVLLDRNTNEDLDLGDRIKKTSLKLKMIFLRKIGGRC